MIKEITTYPKIPSVEYGTDVRIFNDELFTILEDLKDTIIHNNLEALASFQIGNHLNLVVLKNEDGSFTELINPRLISTKGKITTTETTAYFPNLSAKITRYNQISIVYQDRDGANKTLIADDKKSILIQRKLDYNFGATFLSKMSKDEKKQFEQKLEFGSNLTTAESCPTTFKRDYIVKLFKLQILLMFVLLVSSLFISDKSTLSNIWNITFGLSVGAFLTNTIYLFYAHYEAKKYTSCVGCQSGNIIGTTLIGFAKIGVLVILSYFLI